MKRIRVPPSTRAFRPVRQTERMDTAVPGPHRLFFALWPDAALRAQLADAADRVEAEHAPGGRALRPERYHITLQFLGEFSPLPAGLVEAACAAAGRVPFEPFDLVLDRVGSFSGSRVWWLGCSDVPHALQRLHGTLGAALAADGIPVRAHPGFTPHLTIRRNVRRQTAPRPIAPIAWRVDRFVLIDSDPRLGYVHRAGWGSPEDDG